MRSMLSRRFLGLALVGSALLTTGCATNPATGKRQLALISEAQEVKLGKENDEAIVRQMGLYPDEGLQAYIQDLGAELAAESERPHLPWTFRLLDDPIVNAFALPGGYVYITRGIMAHLNSEAELVAVLGHEIGHVTARHGVNRLSKAQLMQIGLGVGMIATPELAQQYGQLAELGLGLLFLKYSRDDERQADELGFRYTVAGRYDPRQMPNVFRTLQSVGEAAGAGGTPSFMATHPDPGNRALDAERRAAEAGIDYADYRIERDSYYQRIDGMTFGEDPRQGFFEEALFRHPDLAFQLRFPSGWKTLNQPDAVKAASQEGDALIEMRITENGDLRAAVRGFLTENELLGERVQTGRIHGNNAAWTTFESPAPSAEEKAAGAQQLAGKVVLIRYGDLTYRLMGITPSSKWGTYRRTFDESLSSFQRETDRDVLALQPARVGVVRLNGDLTLPQIGERYPSSVPLDTLALINQVGPDARLSAGQFFKRVTGGVGH